ncbi:cell division protein FtsX [Rhodospirillum centenum]|uniref:Cell division protein, putative n=1 Tax=Rhodospirillum centenum (strain ATCC 51521 / SW) TaxID=414684 RepID=B6IYR3_RHOCS|nr:FtsX-like permease family protein [Rhodospirillum centenum]ACJ01437.1 cell division protein, putative [Rhodospirillum centenum SW]
MSRRGHYDIPLKRDATGRFLPWIIALMVYLASLSLVAAMVMSDLAARWDTGLSGSLTVQVRPLSGKDAPTVEARVQDVLKRLEGRPSVTEVRALPHEEAVRLVEPWLGSGALLDDLPVPALIDLSLRPDADAKALAAELKGAVPGVEVDDPGDWLAGLRRLAATVQWVSAAVVGLIGAVAVASVIFAASAGLAVHRAEVELLHVIGASDGYVAGQFQRHVLRLTLIGGAAGLVLALLTLWGLDAAAQNLTAALLPRLSLTAEQWLSLAGVPAAAALLAAVTARLTVMRALERLP